jgi:hypothetical protein
MVQTRLQADAGTSSQEMAEFMRQMVESMEVLKKQNEDLNTRLMATETRNVNREQERERRQEE